MRRHEGVVREIMATPLVCGDVDEVFEEACETGLFGKVDQLGVTRDGRVIGVCARPAAEGVTLGAAMEPLRSDMLVSANTPVLRLFGDWKRDYYLVVEGTEFVGMVTPSDLNRVPVYAALFDVLAIYEEHLSSFLETKFESGHACLPYLSGEEQGKTYKIFDKLKKQNFDVNLVRALPLGLKHKVLVKIGCHKDLGKLTDTIATLRNKVAHLTPLVETSDEVQSIARTLGLISSMHLVLDDLSGKQVSDPGGGSGVPR